MGGNTKGGFVKMFALSFAECLVLDLLILSSFRRSSNYTAEKMKFSIKDFFSKCGQIRRKLWIWSHLLKKFLMQNFAFCAVLAIGSASYSTTVSQPIVEMSADLSSDLFNQLDSVFLFSCQVVTEIVVFAGILIVHQSGQILKNFQNLLVELSV